MQESEGNYANSRMRNAGQQNINHSVDSSSSEPLLDPAMERAILAAGYEAANMNMQDNGGGGGGGYEVDAYEASQAGLAHADAVALVYQLQTRVRELTAELANAHDLRQGDARDCQKLVDAAEEKQRMVAQKLAQERESHSQTRAANKTLADDGRAMNDRFKKMQNLYRKERVARALSWARVGQQNMALQKLRKEETKLNKKLQDEKRRREVSDVEREAMASRIEPLMQRNLDMTYRISLYSERGDDAGSQIALLGRELQAERHFAERLSKQSFDSAQERAIALEDAARRQLQVEELYDETRELTATLHDTEDRNDDLTQRLEASEARCEQLTHDLEWTTEELTREREAHAECRARLEATERALSTLRQEHDALVTNYEILSEEHAKLQALVESQRKELVTFRKHTPLLRSALTKSTYARLEHSKHKREGEIRAMLDTVRDLPIPSRWVPHPPEKGRESFPAPRDMRVALTNALGGDDGDKSLSHRGAKTAR